MTDIAQPQQSGFRTKLDNLTLEASEIPVAPLGPFGDIPAAYAIFKATFNARTGKTERSYYIYASPEYCRLVHCKAEEIVGCSHLEVVKSEHPEWIEASAKAVTSGEASSGIFFSQITNGWVSYRIAPAQIDDHFVFAFVPVDEQERERQMTIDAKTSLIISELLATMARERGYNAALNGMLERMAKLLNADRLSIFECYGSETKNTFEWCAEGIKPQLGAVSGLSRDVLKAWFRSVDDEPFALVPDTAIIARFSMPLYEWCVETGVNNLMATPFFNEGEIVGFLGAYNYRIDGSVDIGRVFKAISSFVGARIENHRLMKNLAWASEHDPLTGLLNRRGSKAILSKFLDDNPNSPLCIVLIDLDDLKSINDHYGHSAGDKALQAVGESIESIFPQSAILSRSGGDEFLIGLTGEDADFADELVRSYSELEKKYEHEGVTRAITTSIGYALFPDQAATFKETFSKADAALYSVKRSGKARFAKYEPSMK